MDDNGVQASMMIDGMDLNYLRKLAAEEEQRKATADQAADPQAALALAADLYAQMRQRTHEARILVEENGKLREQIAALETRLAEQELQQAEPSEPVEEPHIPSMSEAIDLVGHPGRVE